MSPEIDIIISIFSASACNTYASPTECPPKETAEPIKGISDGNNPDLVKVKINIVLDTVYYYIFPKKLELMLYFLSMVYFHKQFYWLVPDNGVHLWLIFYQQKHFHLQQSFFEYRFFLFVNSYARMFVYNNYSSFLKDPI